jgi:hypothetical protein
MLDMQVTGGISTLQMGIELSKGSGSDKPLLPRFQFLVRSETGFILLLHPLPHKEITHLSLSRGWCTLSCPGQVAALQNEESQNLNTLSRRDFKLCSR